MASMLTLPVFIRIGDTEAEIGTVDIPVSGHGRLTGTRAAVAEFLRAAADAYEHPEQEDPDAPA